VKLVRKLPMIPDVDSYLQNVNYAEVAVRESQRNIYN
jgi:hypothetical protein